VVRRQGCDKVDKEPDTALLPSSKDVQEVGDENGRYLPLRKREQKPCSTHS
jgi:hypothetical protein